MPRRAPTLKCFIAAIVKGHIHFYVSAQMRIHQYIEMLLQDQKWIKNLGSANQKHPLWIVGVAGGTNGSASTPLALPGKEEFLPSKLLPDAWMMMWGSPGTLYILRSHVSISSSLPLYTLSLQTDMLSFLKLLVQLNHLMSAKSPTVLSSCDGL